jgi:choice-of-anchor C domain-containing protein
VKIGILMASATAGALVASSAFAGSLLTNGGFEDISGASPQGWGGYTFGAGYTPVLPGWTVDKGSVDVTQTGSEWGPAAEGTNALDLNGWTAGQISQSFSTTTGDRYTVSFEYSRNPAGAPYFATANVTADNKTVHVVAADDGTFGSTYNMVWKTDSFHFLAKGPSSTFTLTATNPGNGGVFFDNLSVVAGGVPEPATWATMLIGFAALGYMGYRRRAKAAFSSAA